MADRALNTAFIWTNHDDIIWVVTFVNKVSIQDRCSVEMVHGYVKKALYLRGVQVHRQHSIRARPSDHVSHQLGCNWDTAFVFAVLSRIAVIGHHRSDARRAGSFTTVDHDQQFHQIVIDGRASRLNQKDIAAADVVIDFAEILPVRMLSERD